MKQRRAIHVGSFVLAVGLLAWLLWRIGWTRIVEAFSRVGVPGAVLLVGLGMAETLLDGGALWFASARRGGARVVVFNSVGAVVNSVIPFELGEALKAGLLRTRISTQSAVSATIFWNYLFKLSRPLIAVTAALVGWFGASSLPTNVARSVALATSVSFIPYLAVRVLLRQGAAALVIRLGHLLRIFDRRTTSLLDAARKIDAEVHRLWRDRRGDYFGVFFLQAAARFVSWMTLYAGIRLLGIPCSFARGAAVYAAMNVSDTVLSVLPARLGVAEGAAFAVFKILSLDPTTGVILAVLMRLKGLLGNLLMAPLAITNAPPLRDIVELGSKTTPVVAGIPVPAAEVAAPPRKT